MGFFNKGYAEKMTSDSEEFIRQDGRLHALVYQIQGKRIMSASNSLEPRVTEQLNIILDNLQNRGLQIVDVKTETCANAVDKGSDTLLHVVTVLYR